MTNVNRMQLFSQFHGRFPMFGSASYITKNILRLISQNILPNKNYIRLEKALVINAVLLQN